MKRYQVVTDDGNIHFCSVTRKAAENYAAKRYVPHGVAGRVNFTVVKATLGFCPVHRCEHHEYNKAGDVVK